MTKIRNVSGVRQVVYGHGQAAPGEILQVPDAVAAELVRSPAWEPVEEPKASARDTGRKKDKEVTDG